MSASKRTIGLLLHPRESEHEELVDTVRQRAATHGFGSWVCVTDPAASLAEHASTTALLVTVGGDGTFLLGARLAVGHDVPVLGVNRGQLGFLTDVEVGQLPAAIDDWAAGRHRLARRSLLELEITRDGSGGMRQQALALNELAVKSMGSNLARIRVEADADLLGEFDADGVVIATATGSTAYAMSAGGPPIDPRVRATVIVPLAPHAVITRAVVVPEALTITVTLERGRAFAAADGTWEVPLRDGARVVARPGPELSVVQFPESPSFLRRLREKVRFGMPLKESLDEQDWHHTSEAGPAPEPGPDEVR